MPSASLTAGIATASLATSAIGAGVGAIGAISSAQSQSANANYQAQVAKNNATIAANNAEYATQAGQEKAQETSLKAREQQGAITTAIAANGLDVDTGSASDVEKTQAETGSLATQNVVNAAALQAYGYRSNETSFQAQSGLETAEAGQAETAGDISAAGGLLGGASSVGLNYAKLQQAGAFSGGTARSSFGNIASDASNPLTYGS